MLHATHMLRAGVLRSSSAVMKQSSPFWAVDEDEVACILSYVSSSYLSFFVSVSRIIRSDQQEMVNKDGTSNERQTDT